MGAHQKLHGVARLKSRPQYGVAVLVLASLAVPLSRCSLVKIPKCCPLHQQLSYDFDSCIDYESAAATDNDTSWWLSPEVIDQMDAEWVVGPGQRQACSAAESTLWLQELGDVVMTAGGRLELDVGGDSEPLQLELDPHLYCLDRTQIAGGRLVALSCLCGSAPLRCWTSCCPGGSSLSLVGEQAASCVSSQHELPGHWVPQPHLFTPGGGVPWRVTTLPQCEENEHVVVLPAGRRYRLLADGGAAVEDGESPEGRHLSAHQYCADAEHFLYCKSRVANPSSGERTRRVVYVCLLVLGTAFLLATIAIYSCFPVLLSRVLSRALVAHCCSLVAAYVTAAVLHAASHIPHPACTITAFVMQFSYLAAFFWLNVMCIDIALAVSRRSRPQEGSTHRERCKFLLYSGYAWGVPATICAITAAVDFSLAVPTTSQLKPNIGTRTCWFQGETAMLIYFYGPVSCVMVVNLLLFILTAVNTTVKSENHGDGTQTGTIKPKKRTQRERLLMFSKIFILMGLTWVTDILSWIFGGQHKYYWIVTDTINILRPAFIFYIFCCNRRILEMLAAHLPCTSGCSSNHPSSSTESGRSLNVYRVCSNDDSHSPTVQYRALTGREISHGDHHP
ncbi:probable G-protein coupled receptor Mth-like 4 [Schistocerca piceifrons]|uniref:probable G-protein coupled receptor Mth-like 4 n=1 Tax=Schistocerca piceifrons TaxID=274613 RepID=UPI001F5EF0B0|nr:probable G-protein coupled receptor Mth-like 4 [Schistocerca piceifrons]